MHRALDTVVDEIQQAELVEIVAAPARHGVVQVRQNGDVEGVFAAQPGHGVEGLALGETVGPQREEGRHGLAEQGHGLVGEGGLHHVPGAREPHRAHVVPYAVGNARAPARGDERCEDVRLARELHETGLQPRRPQQRHLEIALGGAHSPAHLQGVRGRHPPGAEAVGHAADEGPDARGRGRVIGPAEQRGEADDGRVLGIAEIRHQFAGRLEFLNARGQFVDECRDQHGAGRRIAPQRIGMTTPDPARLGQHHVRGPLHPEQKAQLAHVRSGPEPPAPILHPAIQQNAELALARTLGAEPHPGRQRLGTPERLDPCAVSAEVKTDPAIFESGGHVGSRLAAATPAEH